MFLSESMPSVCDPTTFGLDKAVSNKLKLKNLKKHIAKKIGSLPLASGKLLDVMRSGTTGGSVYAEREGNLVLYIQYSTYRYAFLPMQALTQTKLWRSQSLLVSHEFSHNLFFQIMLPLSGAILSDKEQTSDGQEFWKRRCMEALQIGCHVALVDFGTRSYKEFSDADGLEPARLDSWGGGLMQQHYQQKRWLIWKS